MPWKKKKDVMGVWGDKDDWKDKISANKQLKVFKGDQFQLDKDLSQKYCRQKPGKI